MLSLLAGSLAACSPAHQTNQTSSSATTLASNKRTFLSVTSPATTNNYETTTLINVALSMGELDKLLTGVILEGNNSNVENKQIPGT